MSLYQRFCQLDRNGGVLISPRLLKMLDDLNGKEFVAFLSALGPRATLQNKTDFIYFVKLQLVSPISHA